MDELQIESEDGPLLAMRLYDAGPHFARVFSLLRRVYGVSIQEACEALKTPGYLILTDSIYGLREAAKPFWDLQADVRIEQIQ